MIEDASQEILRLRNEVVTFAEVFIGQKEIPPNLGFEDKNFERHMLEVGWHPGNAWCALTAELIWKIGYKAQYIADEIMQAEINKILSRLCSANSQATYRNFDRSDEFEVSMIPERGDIGVFKSGKTTGHTVIVREVLSPVEIVTVEGNSGDCVQSLSRLSAGWGNYELMGYIKPTVF